MGNMLGLLLNKAYGAVRAMRNLAFAITVSAVPLAADETVTIAALGDSLTQGFGLLPKDGFVPQLQAWLTDQGANVTVLNAGVSGDTTAGGLSRVGWTLSGGQVDGMIVALGGNDLLRGLDPSMSRGNLSGILAKAQAARVGVLLVGMQAPGNYGPDYKAAFDGMYPELAAEYGTVYAESFFVGFDDRQDLSGLSDYLQPDGIHPNAAGVNIIVEGLGPYVLELVKEVSAQGN